MEPIVDSMRSKDHVPPYVFFVVFAILLGILIAVPYYSALKKWFRETFRKFRSCISSCLRVCVCGSEEAERGADAPEQIEMNDLPNDQLDIHHQQNGDYLGAHRDPQPELLMGMREMQDNLINLHPDGDIGGEYRIKGFPEVIVEGRNVLNNL